MMDLFQHPPRQIGKLAQQRPRIPRVDDILDPIFLRRPERRAHPVQPLPDRRQMRRRIVGRLQLALVRDLDPALTVALRVLVIVLPAAVLIPWIDPDRLGDHLAQRLRLPDRPVVATAAALQRVQSFGQIWSELSRARRVRGLGVSWRRPRTVVAHLGALTMGLLVRTLRAAAELAVAMDARGFATAWSRSWWLPAPWRWRDTLLVLLSAVPLAVALLAPVVGTASD